MKKTLTPGELLTQQIDQLLTEGSVETAAPADEFLLLGVQRLLQVMLEAEADEFLGRRRYEITPRSSGRHSGYKTMQLHLPSGELVLRVPRIRGAAVPRQRRLPQFLNENAGRLEYLVDHMYARPLSSEEVRILFTDPDTGESPLSPDLMEHMVREIQNQHRNFRDRGLDHHLIDNLFVSPVRESARENGHRADSLLCAWGIRYDGRAVMLHFAEGDLRDASVWRAFMRNMRERGLPNPNHIFFHGSAAFLPVAREVFPTSLRHRLSFILIPLFAIAALVLVLLDFETPLRTWAVFGFQLLCPGWAFVRLLTLREPVHEFILAILLSLTINTIVSEIMILARVWSPQLAMMFVVIITLCGILLEVVPSRRQRAREQWACYGVGYQL